jgi:hypothetical protein
MHRESLRVSEQVRQESVGIEDENSSERGRWSWRGRVGKFGLKSLAGRGLSMDGMRRGIGELVSSGRFSTWTGPLSTQVAACIQVRDIDFVTSGSTAVYLTTGVESRTSVFCRPAVKASRGFDQLEDLMEMTAARLLFDRRTRHRHERSRPTDQASHAAGRLHRRALAGRTRR